MNPVVAVAALVAVPRAQRVDGREAAVALRIAQAMQSRLPALLAVPGAVHGLGEWLVEPAPLHVERVVVPGDAHRLGHGREDRFGLHDLARLVEGETGERLLLVRAENQPALVVLGDADPRALLRPVRPGDDLDPEAAERLNHVVRVGWVIRHWIEHAPAPGARRRRRLAAGWCSDRRALRPGRLDEDRDDCAHHERNQDGGRGTHGSGDSAHESRSCTHRFPADSQISQDRSDFAL